MAAGTRLRLRSKSALKRNHAVNHVSIRPIDRLRAERNSIKWRRYEPDVLPLFVAEMDFDLAPVIVDAVTHALRSGDTGYLDDPGELAPVFADFAQRSWDWIVDEGCVHLATDVTVGLVEALRLLVPAQGAKVVLTPPVYAPFYEMVGEVNGTVVEVPLVEDAGYSLDLAGLERAFAGGADAMLLCNPQNPTGRCHSGESLRALAELAARYDVPVLSDEVHAPLAHPGAVFTPFAPIAAAAGARSATVTSASKAWNLAALKCAWIVAADARMNEVLDRLPEETAARTSILGLHASIAALNNIAWRDEAVEVVASNIELLTNTLAELVPEASVVTPDAGYLVWLDLRATGLGDDPAAVLREQGRVAFNSGPTFGAGGAGFVRANVACDPSTIVEAVRRIASVVDARRPLAVPAG
ncbi:aminotransferase class I/II-fold pyridoxal phosphate-dependent enzyme [Humibacter ginsenosidimutans]|uniref:cysteine-S-conjugate beta-lyase n=1 Tax=Humibacter ginsenosidimutans TaxID=2599293 RepID=A0A5B8M4Y8_9MICO|nr:aminotransferase class I/II-fold pyridoxal phosphate-dependent enzyme [Humibacter ginsenosidimutans]